MHAFGTHLEPKQKFGLISWGHFFMQRNKQNSA